ncbi:glycosyltransferase [Flavobacterium sp.]|uniref:glycosyltransferase n=1 Tax=Flavobacterium sp. TaxID=239 RepID=UPI0026117101|nr:glycosyltransferase [Flavobacterium sp.]
MTNSKKNLLFIMNDLRCGGAEKSLISLLQTIDYRKYSVDLFLFQHRGIFLNQIPKAVNLLEEPHYYKYFDMPFSEVVKSCFNKNGIRILFLRVLVSLYYLLDKNSARAEQKSWKILRYALKRLTKEYDVAIGYLEKTPNYFCVDKVTAKRKIGYVLNDYVKLKMDPSVDKNYFEVLDFIVVDSKPSWDIIVHQFPNFQHKFKIIQSIISTDSIQSLANEQVADFPDGFSVISIGRLAYQKGYDLALEAMQIAMQKASFNWIILGEGQEKRELQEKIATLGLGHRIFFLGIKENHYSYLKKADLFLHTARFEGYGIVIQEAKILNKAILLTDFNTATHHIEHEKNGYICSMKVDDIAASIVRLVSDTSIRMQFQKQLASSFYGTENEIENFYTLIDSES